MTAAKPETKNNKANKASSDTSMPAASSPILRFQMSQTRQDTSNDEPMVTFCIEDSGEAQNDIKAIEFVVASHSLLSSRRQSTKVTRSTPVDTYNLQQRRFSAAPVSQAPLLQQALLQNVVKRKMSNIISTEEIKEIAQHVSSVAPEPITSPHLKQAKREPNMEECSPAASPKQQNVLPPLPNSEFVHLAPMSAEEKMTYCKLMRFKFGSQNDADESQKAFVDTRDVQLDLQQFNHYQERRKSSLINMERRRSSFVAL